MMPKKMNFSKTTVKLLYLLSSDPMTEFHGRGAAKKAGVSVGATNQILRKLFGTGILDRRKIGKMIFYRLNMKNPVARQFKVLFNVFALNDLVEQIKADCERILLFGSCAEGTDVKESDVDLFVLTSEPALVKRKVSDFERQFGRRISPIVTGPRGLVKLKREDRPLHERISKGIVLWQRD